MQLTIEIDSETFAGIEAAAKAQHASVDSVAARALSRFKQASLSSTPNIKLPHGYKMPVSPSEAFTMEEVRRIEDDDVLRGLP